MIDKDREAFEAWYEDNQVEDFIDAKTRHVLFSQNSEGKYVQKPVQISWENYQARALDADRIAKLEANNKVLARLATSLINDIEKTGIKLEGSNDNFMLMHEAIYKALAKER